MDEDPLRAHLQWHLVGSIHYGYLDAAEEAIALAATGRGEERVEIPNVPLIAADMHEVPLGGDIVPAGELVSDWDLGEFVASRSAGQPDQPA